MQMEKIPSTAELKPTAVTNIGRGASRTDVPVDANDTEKVIADSVRKTKKEDRKELEKAIESLRQYTGWGNFNIGFDVDDKTDSMIIKIIDRDSGETIRQIPPEQILKFRNRMREVVGLVFDHLA